MAKINREYCFYENQLGMAFRVPEGPPIFEGIGWATFPIDWIMMPGRLTNHITLSYGGGDFRILYADKWFSGACVYVVERSNRRWPLWWLLLRIWLFSRWFERNLRLTAAVWGLLKCEPGAMPQWGDFVAWRWVKRERRKTERR